MQQKHILLILFSSVLKLAATGLGNTQDFHHSKLLVYLMNISRSTDVLANYIYQMISILYHVW